MAGLFNILKVTVSEDKICAHVLVNPGMPLMTSEDIEATARVYYLVPAIAKHLCLGDSGREFQDCMGQTELCHLLEHVTVELMNETGLAGSISCGRTRVSEHDERVFEVELSCPDDALAIGALSSATFMMDWAYLHADQPAPDVEGTVAGLRNLVLGMQFLDFFDFLTNSVMMPIAAIATCLLVSRIVGVEKIEEEVTREGQPFRRKPVFNFMLRYLCPIFAAIILASSVANALGWIAM